MGTIPDISSVLDLHARDGNPIESINRHVVKTWADGRRFLLGRINDIEYTPQQGDAYLPDWGLGLFVPDVEAIVASGAARIVPYQPVAGFVEIVDQEPIDAPTT